MNDNKVDYIKHHDIKCKYCGKRLSSSDYIGDFYGVCEGGCDD